MLTRSLATPLPRESNLVMQNSTSFISKACDWWLAGLSRPWSSLAAKRGSKRTVLSFNSDGEFYDQSGRLFDGASLNVLADSAEICLLVPSDLTMSRALSEQHKGLSLAAIAEQLLPFCAAELIYVWDDDGQTVHVAVADEMRVATQALLSHGVSLNSLAFLVHDESGEERLCVTYEVSVLQGEQASREHIGQDESKLKSSRIRAFSIALIPLIFCLIVSALSHYWLSKQEQELSNIETAYNELISEQTSNIAQPILTIEGLSSRLSVRQAEGLSADRLHDDLTSMARNISESTELSQLIVSPAEIIIDASASSGSELQAQLDESKLFESTEFVSSISQNNNGESERFRLKLQRKSTKEQGGR